jgi:hypothetical protein
MGVPPRIGKTVLATIGSMTNISDALRNSVTTNSHTTAFEAESDREVISVGWMTILSRERKVLQTDSRGSQLLAKGVPNHSMWCHLGAVEHRILISALSWNPRYGVTAMGGLVAAIVYPLFGKSRNS